MRILDRAEVERWLEPPQGIEALRREMARALADLTAGRASAPPRIAAHSEAGLLAAMPGAAAGVLGAKLVTVFPHNEARGLPGHQALITLFDTATGEPLAMLDGTAITAARTAAVSAAATEALARNDARVLAILGTGVQAEAHWRALTALRPWNEIRLAGRTPARVAARAAEWGALPCPDFAAAIRGAEVICACTHAAEPIVRRPWLAPGAHVNSVGIGGCELDRETILAGRLVVESRVAFSPFPSGAYELQGVDQALGTELGAILVGAAPGRRSPDEITVFKSIGHAVEDVAAAAWVWRQASGG